MMGIMYLLICCLPTVKVEECKETEIIERRLGTELLINFSLSDLRDEYNKYIIEKKTYESEIEIRNLKFQSQIRFKTKMDSPKTDIIYKNGKQTYLAGNLTEIFMMNDILMIKKRKLQKGDAGIYWMEFRSRRFGHKALIIPGKPTIIGRSPPDPVLKPEDNYNSIIQLECDSVSTSVGDCLPTLNIVWYKNGMRMTDVDPISSQINVTVHYYDGQFICLATDYTPCYQRLQTTKHYDVLNIEECNNVSESETFIVKPEFEPMDVKLKPNQREITLNKNEDLKVRCSAKCHPKCNVRWEKDYQDFESNGLDNLTENSFENDLVIKNVNSSHEGIYVCLVNNIHGEVKKGFTLSVRVEPMDVKLEPDQREITVNKNEDLKVRCSAKCRPKCNVRWEKDYQSFESNGLVKLAENSFEKDLVIKNVSSSYEGIYVCLVNNIHGEVKKNFTLNVRETKDKSFIYAEMNNVIVAVTAVIVIVIVVVIIVVIVIKYKKNRKRKKEILRSLEMRKMPEEWKRIVREPKMIKLEKTEDEVACRTMDLNQDTPLPESKDEAWQKWMRKPWDIGAWKKMLGSYETSKLKTTKGEVSLETMDIHHDKLLQESQDEGICVTTETH